MPAPDQRRVDIDELIARTTPHQVAAHLGIALPQKSSGELRIDCLFCDAASQSSYGNLAVNLDRPHNPIYAHCCGVRGNLLMLMFGMVHGRPPKGGRLQGDEFREMRDLLIEIDGSPAVAESATRSTEAPAKQSERKAKNVPLLQSDKEAARQLANLYEDFVTDPQAMKPAAGQYIRRRPHVTPEVMQRWRMGWIPGNGRSMFRRDFIVYTHLSELGEVLSYSGRDLHFEDKFKKWEAGGRDPEKKPAKHRFVKGYHRGLELFGQHRQRLTAALRESLRRFGLLVVEGPNDVIRLDCLDVAAVGLCSNKATDQQIAKIVRFTRQLGHGRVWLMPDCDSEGEAGFKELLWKLAEQDGIQAGLAWSSGMYGGRFAGREPESLTGEEFAEVIAPRLLTGGEVERAGD